MRKGGRRRRTFGAHNGGETGLGDSEEGVRVGGGSHSVYGDGEGTVGSVFETCVIWRKQVSFWPRMETGKSRTDGEGDPGSEFSVELGFCNVEK